MKIIDKASTLIILCYIVWISFFTLKCLSYNIIHTQLYFIFEALVFSVISLRLLLINKYPISKEFNRMLLYSIVIFKIYQFIFSLFTFTKSESKYLEMNSNHFFSILGISLIVLVAIVFGVIQLLKWVKN